MTFTEPTLELSTGLSPTSSSFPPIGLHFRSTTPRILAIHWSFLLLALAETPVETGLVESLAQPGSPPADEVIE
jgi:hypothetical protein